MCRVGSRGRLPPCQACLLASPTPPRPLHPPLPLHTPILSSPHPRSAMTWQINAAELDPSIAERSWEYPATPEDWNSPPGCLLNDVVNANAAFKTCACMGGESGGAPLCMRNGCAGLSGARGSPL